MYSCSTAVPLLTRLAYSDRYCFCRQRTSTYSCRYSLFWDFDRRVATAVLRLARPIVLVCYIDYIIFKIIIPSTSSTTTSNTKFSNKYLWKLSMDRTFKKNRAAVTTSRGPQGPRPQRARQDKPGPVAQLGAPWPTTRTQTMTCRSTSAVWIVLWFDMKPCTY
eukprot:SAG11_NODE_14865_length_597_cov_0.959839_1_plen_163_part_00